MKAKDVSRAALLVRALNAIDKVKHACDEPPTEDMYLQFRISRLLDDDRLQATLLWVDLITGKLIAEAAEQLIRSELEKLGVDL